MDLTAQQAKVDDLKSQLATAQSSVSSIQSDLTLAEAELAQGTLINQLESLDEASVTTINDALANDAQNTSKISLTLPAPSAAAEAQA